MLDLNDDGIEELFVGAGADSETAGIYSLFSYDGTKPIKLVDEASLGERSRMTVYEDNTFIIHGSGGAAYSSIQHYRVSQDSFVPEVIEEYQYDNGKCYWKDRTGNYRDITQDEFTSVMDHEGMYIKQLNWQEILPENVSKSECENIKLQDYLDISKSWGIRKDVSSSPDYPMEQVFDFAFREDGSFFCLFYQQYTDFYLGFRGVYTYKNNQLNLYVYSDNGTSALYSYFLDCNEMMLTQISEKGLWNDLIGTKYSLVNDEWYPSVQDIITQTENAMAFTGQEIGA